MKDRRALGVRWTIGDVSRRGYEALRLSVWGAYKLFGPEARYAVCVNTVPVARAQALAGDLPEGVQWHAITDADVPAFLDDHLDREMAEGVAWKFSPLRLFPDRYELALDNDCILWEQPAAIRRWLEGDDPDRRVFAEDVQRCLGQFDAFCGEGARNSGIRGLPPGFDYERRLRALLEEHPVVMTSELDEQGLQAATLDRAGKLEIVTVDEVAICSPFPPHRPNLGRCGAHFVGLNAQSLPWSLKGRPATAYLAEHWQKHRQALYERVGIPMQRPQTVEAAEP